MRNHRWICFLLVIQLLLMIPFFEAEAYQPTTLRPGMRGEEVAKMQQALIDLGYLKGAADGIYGTKTENAVRKFQKENGLKPDGLAGVKTLTLLYKKAAEAAAASSSSTSSSETPSSSSGIFGGNYATLKSGMKGARVKVLQKALKQLKYYTGTVDGKFGSKTKKAVKAFQKANKLTVDGKAGKKTLKAIEKALESASSSDSTSDSSSTDTSPSTGEDPDTGNDNTAGIPSIGSLKLLHWFNDIKPTLKNGQYLLLVDPATKLSWTLRLYSLGRHADAEPLTAEDTANMVQAFGGKNTWNQQAVYVKLPSGVWTIGSTHDMPHMSGSISNNNFNGHLCVHFLRDMSECQKNDPKYGVANQKTIREFWKSLTGITIE